MTTRRKLTTADAKDFVIPLNTPFELGYAFVTNSPLISTFHGESYGHETVTLLDDGSYALAPNASVNVAIWIYTAAATISIALL